ncbi:MAG: 3-dehydroquinate synthase [Candidatus Methanophagaceae archaeon]|nr:MAG: 3-dehydroquinate synthase [Methanophagales archaeon]KAF5432181.1 3-dehydroquinate synthase II [Methanophagales archaeon]
MKGKEKEIWIKADDRVGTWDEKKARITASLESGIDGVLVEETDIAKTKELGRIKIAAFVTTESPAKTKKEADIIVYGKNSEGDGTKPVPSDINESIVLESLKKTAGAKPKAAYVEIRAKASEQFAVNIADHCDYVVVIGTDWKIIPLENIIAELQHKETKVIAGVHTAEEVRTAFETLEHGADGVLLDTDDISEIKRAAEIRDESQMGKVPLSTARVTHVEELEMGDRVCVDTCSLMSFGEGMLVGSQSFALFMVHSESEESPYVAARPFRVNAGAVYAYVLVGEKTRYLSELTSGDGVLVVNSKGNLRKAVIGRVKIEKRPLMLVEAEVEMSAGEKRPCSIILQNAETIKLMGKTKPISVVELKEGDEVLVHVTKEARHFGIAVEEMVIEK